ncbi:hypothetical protein HanXRQr2_Chr10g0424371 [Helianthus annuus]|uniref:Uncharacterized protein n=1 Tax=Helianthus annuus TaxID=4232 RepID=A0A9K3HVC2_HELAN|nr:hypothetical protein HanXRQr2_Chr10g0424371 [Helianthus annuus]
MVSGIETEQRYSFLAIFGIGTFSAGTDIELIPNIYPLIKSADF